MPDRTPERRRRVRFAVDSFVSFSRTDAEKPKAARILDLSWGGIRFEYSGADVDNVDLGQDLLLSIVNGAHSVTLRGEVVRRRSLAVETQQVAVAFDELNHFLARDSAFDSETYPLVTAEMIERIVRSEGASPCTPADDVSRNGVRFDCAGAEFGPGQILKVTAALGNQCGMVLIGKVVRVIDLGAFAQTVALAFLNAVPTPSTRGATRLALATPSY